MTHDDLVHRAAKWLAGTMRCEPILTEYGCWATREQPDAFGICSSGTILVECKMSVADYHADREKPFRQIPQRGMGRLRFYMTPPGLLSPELLARRPGWGLLEVHPKTVRVIRKSDPFAQCSNAECLLFRSAWINDRLRGQLPPADSGSEHTRRDVLREVHAAQTEGGGDE